MYKLAISTALLRLASAQIITGTSPDELSSSTWESVQTAPNLTTVGTFTGPLLTEAYAAGGKTDSEYQLRLAIKDDISLKGNDENKLTAETISLLPPKSDDVDVDDSWRVCLHVFPVNAASAGGAWGDKVDPTCDGVVSPECVDDLKKTGVKKFGGGCPSWKITPSCLRDLEEVKGTSVSLTKDTAKDLVGNSTSFYRETLGDHPATEEEPTVLVEALAKPRAVVSVWGSSKDSDDNEDPYVAVTCLRVDSVEEDSYDPAPPSAASGLSVVSSWVVVGVAAVQMLF